MNCRQCKISRARRSVPAEVWLMVTMVLALCVPTLGGSKVSNAKPDFSIGAAQYPDEDAIILRWEQDWTVQKDGTVHRRDHKWLKLLNSRPIRRAADPRLDFEEGRDKLIIHVAQTHLPNGEILRVPEYSFNIVGPDDVAGWPEYANWQQMVVSYSGIEKNVVLEMDYEVVTPAGVLPWVDGDLRLEQDYPTVERVVSVTLPEGSALHNRIDGVPAESNGFSKTRSKGMVTYRWVFRNLAGGRGEDQSPPWRQRCARLRFTSATGVSSWVTTMLQAVDGAAQPGDGVKAFAEAAVDGETDGAARIEKIAQKLHDSFNYLSSYKTMRSCTCRSAEEVLQSNYGSPLESAALLAAALRAQGMETSVAVAVDAKVWDEQVPTNSAFDGVVVKVELADGPVYVHPQEGVFENPGHFGRRWLLSADSSGSVSKTYVYARGEQKPSELHATGKITVDKDGRASGELRLRLTGLFYDPLKLKTSDAQEKLVNQLTERLVGGFEVSGYSITTLSDSVLRVTVSVSTEDPLKQYAEQYVVRFSDGPAFLGYVPMPLARSYRRTDVQLAGAFREHVDLTIELPEGWKPSIVPGSPAAVDGAWGKVAQSLEVKDNVVRLRREVTMLADVLSPSDFEKVRRAVGDLCATRSLLLSFGGDSGNGD